MEVEGLLRFLPSPTKHRIPALQKPPPSADNSTRGRHKIKERQTSMATVVAVEMGELWVSGTPDERLLAAGLGACVGLCLYDPSVRLGAMAHIVLPHTPDPPPLFRGRPLALRPGKCADTALPLLLDQIIARGARVGRLRAAIAGGAHLFSPTPHDSKDMRGTPIPSRLEIGPRCADAVRAALAREGIPLWAEDTGGTFGRTLSLCVRTGDFWVQRIGGDEQKLAALGEPMGAALAAREAAYGH